jgi:peroxiredoxin Q/BCP
MKGLDMLLEVGMNAPDFSLLSDLNEQVVLSKLRGKKVVLYFYPKDDTPGCTQESCDFRDRIANFQNAKSWVFGVSKDDIASHNKFKNKYNLNFPLLADTDGKVCEQYGVIVEKSMYGKKYMGIERTTFLIDEKGIIKKIWNKVKVPGHVDEVMVALKS